jgi:hypothetical protein
MSNEELKTPEDLHRKEINEHGKTLGNPKRTRKKKSGGCSNCKKNELIETLPEVEDETIPTYDDIVKVYNILQVPNRLHDPINLVLAEKIYKEVTGSELNVRGCFSCKGSSNKRMFVYHAKEKYGIELK